MIKIIKKSALVVVLVGLFFGATMQPRRAEENKPWQELLQQAVDENNWAMFDRLLNVNPANIDDAVDFIANFLAKLIEEKDDSLFFSSLLEYVNEHALFDLEHGFMNIPNLPERYSLLHLAAWYGKVDEIHALLSSGVDPLLQVNGETFLKIAIRAGKENVVNYYLENGLALSGDEVMLAVLYNKVDIVYALYRHNLASINQADVRGITPLMAALYTNFLEVAKLLLKVGAQVNIASMGGLTPLKAAFHIKNQYFVDQISAALLRIHRKGGEINAVDRPFIMKLSQESCTQHVV